MLLQGFGGYTRGCASAPPRNSTAARREECPISKRQPLRVPDGYHSKGSGATVGDNHKGPLIAGEKPLFRKIIKRKQTRKPQITPRVVAIRCGEGPMAQITSAAHQVASLGTPQVNFRLAREPGTAPRNLHLARGLCAPSGDSPPRSRAPRLLERLSASLEGSAGP
jgi:hypothetical protein